VPGIPELAAGAGWRGAARTDNPGRITDKTGTDPKIGSGLFFRVVPTDRMAVTVFGGSKHADGDRADRAGKRDGCSPLGSRRSFFRSE